MNEPQDHDYVEALLSWYVNGTLTEEERAQVTAHLEHCGRCREEVRFLTGLQQGIKRVADTSVDPELGLKRLMREIDAETPARRRTPWWQPSLAAAAVVILVQGVLLFNLWQRDDDIGVRLAGEAPPAEAVILQIQFDADAREEEIRALLRALDARFVDGPSAVGLYRIELSGVTPGDERALARALNTLREQREIVRHVAVE